MPANLYMADYGAAAFERLRETIAKAQSRDQLSPVTVVVPSNYTGLSLRRQLARLGPVVNVRFLVLSRVTELLGAPALADAGKRPMAAWVRAEAIRAAVAAHVEAHPESMFAEVEDHLATEETLEATFRDIRDASESTLVRLESAGGRAGDVVAIFRRYRAATSDSYYDLSDLAHEAARAVEAGAAALRDIGHVIVFLPRSLSEAEAEFVLALSRAGQATIILGRTGDAAADATSTKLQERLASGVVRPTLFSAEAAPTATHVVAVTDAQEEVRTVARQVMERLKAGTPLHRMAVAYPVKETYAAAIHEHLSAAQIPHNGPAVATLGQSLAGRFLRRLLALPATGFRRDEVMDWLASGPVIEQEGSFGRVPSGWWDTISREAAVVTGPTEWQERLRVYRRAQEAKKEDTERPPSEGRIRQIDRALPQIDRLAAFIEELVERLDPGTRGTWKEFGEWARGLLIRYLGANPRFSGCPEGQQETEERAHELVLEQIANLEALDAVRLQAGTARPVTLETFRRALEQLLEAPGMRREKFGTGVFNGSFRDLTGMDFDTVFVLGMVEGQAPALGGDDPLLPDSERLAADPTLPLRVARRADEARDYFAALASAKERVLFVPAANLGGQQKYQPSRWLLASAQALVGTGGTLGVDDFNRLPPSGWLTRIASFHQAVAGQWEPGLLQEYDIRLLRRARWPERHPLARREASIGRGITATRSRRSRQLSQFDGVFGAAPELRPTMTSPTALQTWAQCPFSYFLRNVLRVSEREEPETILVLSAAERGSLIHEALQLFMTENAGHRGPWSIARMDRLMTITELLCAQKEAEGITGKPLLWHLERDRIQRDLAGFLESDAETSESDGFSFLAGEHGFGERVDGEPPVRLKLADGSEVAFRGRIDRVDRRDGDGALAVYDYKTGSMSRYKGMENDATQAGTLLQLPVYALAARQAFGGTGTVRAAYWFVTQREEFEKKPVTVDPETLEKFRGQVQVIADGIGAGLFPPNPGKPEQRPGLSRWANCHYCPYDRLCQQDRKRAWDRKQGDGRAAGYLALAGNGVTDDDS